MIQTYLCHSPRQCCLFPLKNIQNFSSWRATLCCHMSKIPRWIYKFVCREETCQTSWDRWRWCGWPGCTTRSCPCRSRVQPALKERLSLCRFWDCRWKCLGPRDLWWTQDSWEPSQDPRSWMACANICHRLCSIKHSFIQVNINTLTAVTPQPRGSGSVPAPATPHWSMWRRWCCRSRRWSSAPRRCRCWCQCCSPAQCTVQVYNVFNVYNVVHLLGVRKLKLGIIIREADGLWVSCAAFESSFAQSGKK